MRRAQVGAASTAPLCNSGRGGAPPRHVLCLAAGCQAVRGVADRPPPRPQRVQASFFGVGAPEALLVGVVALIVFGPKGLAEVCPAPAARPPSACRPRADACAVPHQAVKSLGKTLKTFQPTIRELASVSSDLKNTLEEQIGLDDIRAEFRNSTVPVRRASSVSNQARERLGSARLPVAAARGRA